MLYCNIIHRTEGNAIRDSLRFQQDTAHKLGFQTTLLATYRVFFRPEMIEYCKSQRDIYGDELGYFCHPLEGAEYKSLTGTDDPVWLQPYENKKKYFDSVMSLFKKTFGNYPKSIAAYYLDAKTLSYIKETYPCVKIAIVNCFDEGVHMYTGCLNSWYLFCEGGPWTAYYPSKGNSMCPAHDVNDAIGIIGVPHLNRDMLMAYTSRDDYFSSHTANMQRGKCNDRDQCDYLYDFFDEWILQAQINGHGYYNIYAGASWLERGYENETPEDCHSLYEQALSYYRKKQDEGLVQVLTMGEYAEWHGENVAVNSNDVVLWKDLLCKSKRQLFWAVNPHYRLAVDPNIGGAIVDLRPYSGRVPRETGPDCVNSWDGSYPFLISMEHRTSFHTCEIQVNSAKTTLMEYRTTGTVEKQNGRSYNLNLRPVTFELGGVTLTIQTIYSVDDANTIHIRRKLLDISDPNAAVTFTETVKASWGTTQYPENLRGTELKLLGEQETILKEISFAYRQRTEVAEGAKAAVCDLPTLGTRMELSGEFEQMQIEEGRMFDPFYTLKGTVICKVGEEINVWLKIK